MSQALGQPPRTVVIGASGFIGTRLVRRLTEQGHAVIAVDIAPPREHLPGVDYVTADARQPLDLKIGAGAQALYNLAAVHRTPGHHAHEYYETNVFGAGHVTALAEANQIPLIVFTSSISVYGPTEEVRTEASPPSPTSDYGRSKLMAELIHQMWLKANPSRRLITVRPGVVFGPGERGNYSTLAGALQRGMFVYPGRRDTVKSGGHVDELLRTLEFAVERQDRDILFNFAFPAESTTQDIVAAFSQVMNRPFRPATAPLPALLLAARLFEVANALGAKTPIHRERVMKLVRSTRIAPQWLLANGYGFEMDLVSSLDHWAKETEGRFE
ncbi:MAG: NAD(P)-dependent oxidoreductase [Phenylobacterium sp.]|uniref:NAD-dependent epimerase/dehydratase family protein n=1 Tax=Phenylobacterium sp. TaxID=1871053 RepID=UPI0025EC61F8|nr:NAD(P)-dependent oxidoreductase [Phenylobacterium sp.]MCG9917555.1 NAD(P)-dependent oxidoreductase [Phenylobacterium sp.]